MHSYQSPSFSKKPTYIVSHMYPKMAKHIHIVQDQYAKPLNRIHVNTPFCYSVDNEVKK